MIQYPIAPMIRITIGTVLGMMLALALTVVAAVL